MAERSYIEKLDYTSRLYSRRMVKLIKHRHAAGDPVEADRTPPKNYRE